MTFSTDNARSEAASGKVRRWAGASKLDYFALAPFIALGDIAIILLLSFLSAQFFSETETALDATRTLGNGIAASVAFVLATQARGLYRPWRLSRAGEQLAAAITDWTFAVLFVGTVIFCFKVGDDTSRLATGVFAGAGFLVLPVYRWVIATWLRKELAAGKVMGRPTIVIGDEYELANVAPTRVLEYLGLLEVRRFVLPKAEDTTNATDNEILKAALQFARQQRVDEVVVAMPWSDLTRLERVRAQLRALPLSVKLLPDLSVNQLLDAPRVDFGQSVAIEVQRAPLSRFELGQKRVLDIAVSGVAMTVLLPLFAAIAIAIKLDSKGPVIFRQRRNGFGGRQFTIFKFRSMTVMEDGAVVTQAQRNDKRVTRVGKFLRSTSLDELPQILNVLFGHMSVVGPRPHAIAHDDAYSKLIAGYAFRQHVKPGITGWAQCKGFRGETAQLELMERRIELDLWYINNWSIWLDLQIIARTFLEVLRHKAY